MEVERLAEGEPCRLVAPLPADRLVDVAAQLRKAAPQRLDLALERRGGGDAGENCEPAAAGRLERLRALDQGELAGVPA